MMAKNEERRNPNDVGRWIEDLWVALEEHQRQMAKIRQRLVGLQLNDNQGQQINKDGIHDVAQNQPTSQHVQVVNRRPIHQAPRHPQRGPIIDFDDEADEFYGGHNQHDIPDQSGYKMRVEILTFDGNMNIDKVLD